MAFYKCPKSKKKPLMVLWNSGTDGAKAANENLGISPFGCI